MSLKWDQRFLRLAAHIAQWSKDPSTKVGAVIVSPLRTIVSVGYNGFPRGMQDLPIRYKDREEKLRRTVHAEMNAILNANEQLDGYTLYTYPLFPCEACSLHIIQSGIAEVVSLPWSPEVEEKWGASFRRSMTNLQEANIRARVVTYVE